MNYFLWSSYIAVHSVTKGASRFEELPLQMLCEKMHFMDNTCSLW